MYALCSRSMCIGAEMSRKDGPLVTKVALFWVTLFFGQLGYRRPADAQACEGLDRALGSVLSVTDGQHGLASELVQLVEVCHFLRLVQPLFPRVRFLGCSSSEPIRDWRANPRAISPRSCGG